MEFSIVKDPDKIHPAVQDRTNPEYLNGSKRIWEEERVMYRNEMNDGRV